MFTVHHAAIDVDIIIIIKMIVQCHVYTCIIMYIVHSCTMYVDNAVQCTFVFVVLYIH